MLQLFDLIDANGDGSIDLLEFVQAFKMGGDSPREQDPSAAMPANGDQRVSPPASPSLLFLSPFLSASFSCASAPPRRARLARLASTATREP